MNNEKVGKFIASLRKSKNLTQQQLGDMVGVGGKSVSKWERGINMPDVSIINEVSKILGVTSNELLNGEFDKKSTNEHYRQKKSKKRYRLLLIMILCLILIISILLLFRAKNPLYEYHLESDNSNFLIEGSIKFNKEEYIINISRIYCMSDECKNIVIDNIGYFLSVNNVLVYRYNELSNNKKDLLFNDFINHYEINFMNNYDNSVITYNGLKNSLANISILLNGFDNNEIEFKYQINLEITDKKV